MAFFQAGFRTRTLGCFRWCSCPQVPGHFSLQRLGRETLGQAWLHAATRSSAPSPHILFQPPFHTPRAAAAGQDRMQGASQLNSTFTRNLSPLSPGVCMPHLSPISLHLCPPPLAIPGMLPFVFLKNSRLTSPQCFLHVLLALLPLLPALSFPRAPASGASSSHIQECGPSTGPISTWGEGPLSGSRDPASPRKESPQLALGPRGSPEGTWEGNWGVRGHIPPGTAWGG